MFEEPVPPNVIHNIQELAHQNPTVSVHVYCGTSQCVRSAKEVSAENIEVKFLVISDIVKGTPMEKWLIARHPLNKVLAGVEFENHLHEAVRLGFLWKYGGLYIDPTVKILGEQF